MAWNRDTIKQAAEIVRDLMALQGLSQVAAASLAGIKRPNLNGWLHGKNGMSSDRFAALLRAVHLTDGRLDGGYNHRWVTNKDWDALRLLMNRLLCDHEKAKLEIFHIGKHSPRPTTIMRCYAEWDEFLGDGSGPYGFSSAFHIVVTQSSMARVGLGLLTSTILGFGIDRDVEPQLSPEQLANISYQDLALSLVEACSAPVANHDLHAADELSHSDDLREGLDELIDNLQARRDTERQLSAMCAKLPAEDLRFLVELISRQPGLAKALREANACGYSHEDILRWNLLLLDTRPLARRILGQSDGCGVPDQALAQASPSVR